MFVFLHHLFRSQNQFASGGLLLMLIGSVSVFLRSLPEHLLDFFLHQTTMTITVKDDDAAFAWVKEWFLEQRFLKRVRRVDLDTTLRGAEMALLPAPGTHVFWHQRRPFWVQLVRSEDTKGRHQRRTESLTFQTPGRDPVFLKQFVAEIVACHRRKNKEASSLYMYSEYWMSVQAYSPRLLASVVLKPGEKERLMRDLNKFRASRQRYRRLGVPYHRGYLLYGPPGTGKTSLVSGLAAAFGMSIYAVNLTEMNDRTLKTAINEVPEHAVILFEDIDGMQAGHRRAERNAPVGQAPKGEKAGSAQNRLGVTLSGLLNVLDGFHAPENVIFVMTTNDVESLDPALLRPGRIDYKLFMGEAVEEQKIELYRRFFPGASSAEAEHFAQAHTARTMAEFQGLLLRLDHDDAPPVTQTAAQRCEAPACEAGDAEQQEACDEVLLTL